MHEKILGSGELKINRQSVKLSFTVPMGPCQPEALLPDLQRFANQLADLAVADVKRAGLKVSCSKGCGACCRKMVPISPPEARYLAALVEAMPPEQAQQVRDRFASACDQVQLSGLPRRIAPGEDHRAHGIAYFRLGVPCPFLADESCSIHPDRPLSCREYLVTSPPKACAELDPSSVKRISVPKQLWRAFFRCTSADGSLEWMPLTEALDFASTNPPPPADRTEPQYVEALLKELQT